MSDEGSKGYGAITSAIVSVVGLLAALHPSWARVVTLAAHTTELSNVVPVALTALGTLGAALSHPPAWLRAPWDRLKAAITAWFAPRVFPPAK